MSDSDSNLSVPPVAIVMVNWNNWRDCIECIDSLLAMDYGNFHIFLVDNDSRDHSVEHIEAWCASPSSEHKHRPPPGVRFYSSRTAEAQPIPVDVASAADLPHRTVASDCRVSLIRSGGNLGFAGGCNVGVRSATLESFDYFWFLNTDTVVAPDALSQLIERATSDPRYGMVGATVLYHDKPDIVQAQAGAHLNPANGVSRHIGEGTSATMIDATAQTVERQLTYIFGASMLVSTELIRKVGLMQEDYFLYYEEMDWAMRSRAYFHFGYAPHSFVYHKSGNSSSKAMPLFTANLFYRNRLRFMSRFMPHCLSATRRELLGSAIRSLVKGRWAEARLIGSIVLDAKRIAIEALQPTAHPPKAA